MRLFGGLFGSTMTKEHQAPFEAFLQNSHADRERLRCELATYVPDGILRVFEGTSEHNLREVTEDRIAAIQKELARIEATIAFVSTLARVL